MLFHEFSTSLQGRQLREVPAEGKGLEASATRLKSN